MTALADLRTWTLTIPAPAKMFSENTSEHWRTTGPAVKAWREAAYMYAIQARLPKHLTRIRLDVVLHFTDARERDSLNYHKYVVKPLTDGLCRSRTVAGKNGVRVEPGYELVDDDSPRYLEGPFPTIGVKVDKKTYPLGLAVITITEVALWPTG